MSENFWYYLEVGGLVAITFGTLLTLVASIGVVRFPSLLQRQHAATKPQLVGFIFTCTGVAMVMQTWGWVAVAVLAIVLQTVTAPIGAHLIGRAARQAGIIRDVCGEPSYHYLTVLPPTEATEAGIAPDRKQTPPDKPDSNNPETAERKPDPTGEEPRK